MSDEYQKMLVELKAAGHRIVGGDAAPRLSPRDLIVEGVAIALVEFTRPLERRISALELVVLEKVASPRASSAALRFWEE